MTVAGIDIGGTTIRVAAVADDGTLLARRTTPTQHVRSGEQAIATLERLIDAVAADAGAPVRGIGIGATGPVDHVTGVLDNPHSLAAWGRLDLATPLRERFGVPVAVDNDANAAALGESWHGEGGRARRFAAVTVGTGIGVGLLVDGVIVRASDGRHGEGGHHVLDPHGPPCTCGARGCWEALAAGPALARMARMAPRDSLVHELSAGRPDAIRGELVVQAARAGDRAALGAVHACGRWIGYGLANLAAFFCPDLVVLGGGMGAQLDLLAPAIAQALAERAAIVPVDFALRAATTGDDAGLVGAARLALERAA